MKSMRPGGIVLHNSVIDEDEKKQGWYNWFCVWIILGLVLAISWGEFPPK
jgi:hypothetical protein